MPLPFAILDFPPSPSRPAGTSLLFENAVRVLSAVTLDDVEEVLEDVDIEVNRGRHAVGFVAYEAAPAFDPAFAAHRSTALPLAWFGIFDAPRPHREERPATAAALWRERTSEAQFARAIATVRDAIARGDVYQVNYTVRLDVGIASDAGDLYRRLLAAQGPGYGARIHTGRFEVLSASPELFFERNGDHILTKPMKGTARRGRWLEEDDERAAALAASEKERAENVMIVDLLRNDIGRIARTGSVTVPRLFEVERRPTVLQMTSTVEATLEPGVSTRDIFAALFPCGSVTGAPKIAASRAIASLEESARGVYCGAIGHVAPGGQGTFSVAIRTVTHDHHTGRTEYGVGSGITWDSSAVAEYDEVMAKAAILTHDLPTFDLLETLRLEHGSYARIERHLARVESSAGYFGFHPAAAVREGARRVLAAHAQVVGAGARERVRVRISATGAASIEASPLPEPAAGPLRVALALSPVKRQNRFLHNKTTHRAVYDRHRAEQPRVFDVLLWNEERELTEFTIGNLVAEIDGVRWTPPRDCGLLAGTFRAELLERGEIRERVITRDELGRVTRMWLVNSVREWVEVALAGA